MATLTEHKQNDFSLLVEAAARLAQRLHQGQVDKAGMDYFSGHLTAVAAKGRTWQEQVVGYLHDAAEDTPHTVEEVIQLLEAELGAPITMLYRDELSTALHLLNHHAAADRNTYIEAIGQNPLATAVKLHDLSHNYCCPVKVFLMIKIRLKPSCRISASFVTLLVGKKLVT